MESTELIVHPVRLRIINAFGGERELTTTQLCAALPDVHKATVYRQVALLADNDVLEVVHERRSRGAVERTFRLNRARATIGADQVAAATRSDHRTTFAIALSALIAEFGGYLDRPDADPTRDLVGYRQHSIWLSPDEAEALVVGLREAITPFIANKPDSTRTRYVLSPIVFPAAG